MKRILFSIVIFCATAAFWQLAGCTASGNKTTETSVKPATTTKASTPDTTARGMDNDAMTAYGFSFKEFTAQFPLLNAPLCIRNSQWLANESPHIRYLLGPCNASIDPETVRIAGNAVTDLRAEAFLAYPSGPKLVLVRDVSGYYVPLGQVNISEKFITLLYYLNPSYSNSFVITNFTPAGKPIDSQIMGYLGGDRDTTTDRYGRLAGDSLFVVSMDRKHETLKGAHTYHISADGHFDLVTHTLR